MSPAEIETHKEKIENKRERERERQGGREIGDKSARDEISVEMLVSRNPIMFTGYRKRSQV
jgi:hypothetical protein